MNIEEIKINEYGKLKNKNIKLKKGINIIQGINESGKSTLLNYITNSFYGISKTKDGREVSDYEKYKPWNGSEFSGKISYSLDDGKRFEVFRDFDKKNPKIYNENLEDISQNFVIDKKDGNQFFVEQTGISKQMYLSTVVSMQQEVRLEEREQNALIQKIANIAGTGEDNVSYKKAQERLQIKIRDEVGTNSTKQKPLNIVLNKLKQIDEETKKITPFENRKYEIEKEKEQIEETITELEKKEEQAKEIKKVVDGQSLTKQKIEINNTELAANNKNLSSLYADSDSHKLNLNNINSKLKDLEQNQKKLEEDKINVSKKGENNSKEKSKIDFGVIFLVLIAIAGFILKNKIAKISVIVSAILILAIYVTIKIYKNNKKTKENRIMQNNQIFELEKKLNLLKENIQKLDDDKNKENFEISKIEGKIDLLENRNKQILEETSLLNKEIKNNLSEKLSQINLLNREMNIETINQSLNELEKQINNTKIKQNALLLEENTIIPHLDKLVSLEEEKINCQNEYKDLINKSETIKKAGKILEEAYEEMKKNITPKFTQNLSNAINIISNNKYSKVTVNDEKGIIVEDSRGEYIEASKLSCGTIDQLYLGLRLSMIEDLSEEKMPIMLDETFAYFDEQRLKQTLKYLYENLNNHQAIIFTCSNREKNILDNLNLEYNIVEL